MEHAGAGMGGLPRGRSSLSEQRDKSSRTLNFPQLSGVAEQAAHLSQGFFNDLTLFTPDPLGGHPTHLSTSGGFPPQTAKMYVHLEVPSGILFQP